MDGEERVAHAWATYDTKRMAILSVVTARSEAVYAKARGLGLWHADAQSVTVPLWQEYYDAVDPLWDEYVRIRDWGKS